MLIHVVGAASDLSWLEESLGSSHQVKEYDGRTEDVRCLVCFQAGEPSLSSPFIIRVLPEEGAVSLIFEGEFADATIVRGPDAVRQLRQWIQVAERLVRAAQFSGVATSPFSHDLRGIASVVRLCAQVLEQQGPSTTGKKLTTAAQKMIGLLDDLKFASHARLDGEEDAEPQSVRSAIQEVTSWFEGHHRDRPLAMETSPAAGELHVPQVGGVLRGLVDVVSRLSRRTETVGVVIDVTDTGLRLDVRTSLTELSEETLRLLATPPSEWQTTGSAGALFRYVSTALVAERNGGRAALVHDGSRGELRATCFLVKN
jgi:hypothetical protein